MWNAKDEDEPQFYKVEKKRGKMAITKKALKLYYNLFPGDFIFWKGVIIADIIAIIAFILWEILKCN